MSRLLDRPPWTAVGLVWPGRPIEHPRVEGDGRRLRVVTANALRTNDHPGRWARAVLAPDPDVLCVQELTPAVDSALRECELPYHCKAVRRGSAGTGLWSRQPLEDAVVHNVGHAIVVGRVDGVTIASVHAVAPSSRRKEPRWHASYDAVAAIVESTDGPLVLAGDWNATYAHGPLRALLSSGRVRDAHTDVGRWRARTWPSRLPVALLDRVLVSDHIAVRDIWELRAPGSDHLPVVADLAICS